MRDVPGVRENKEGTTINESTKEKMKDSRPKDRRRREEDKSRTEQPRMIVWVERALADTRVCAQIIL